MKFHKLTKDEVILSIDTHIQELQNHQLINEHNLLKFIHLELKKRRQPYFDRWCHLANRQLFLTAMLKRRISSYGGHVRKDSQTDSTSTE